MGTLTIFSNCKIGLRCERRWSDHSQIRASRDRTCEAQADRKFGAYDLLSARYGDAWVGDPSDRQANTEALRLFLKAIELDPDFAAAYGMDAWCYVWRKTMVG